MTADQDIEQAMQKGRSRFMGLDLSWAPGTLVPRLETELLGWSAVNLLGGPATAEQHVPMTLPMTIIDMCCGAGNLACALAHHLPRARVLACDLSPACVDLARRNVQELQLHDRVEVLGGDLFSPLTDRSLDGSIDAVVCNPPYISTGRLRERDDLHAREPWEAFDGGPYGIAIHQRVVREAAPLLRPGGFLLFEIGAGQERQVRLLLQRAGCYGEIAGIRDEVGEVRVVIGRKRG